MDKLVVLCHAIHGDGTVNAYVGPDTEAVRRAVRAVDDEYGPGMFRMADTVAVDCTGDDEGRPATDAMAVEFIASLSWWGSGAEDEMATHRAKAARLLA